jgi:hypothetical protein
MSPSDAAADARDAERAAKFAELASEVAALCAETFEDDSEEGSALSSIPDDSLGQLLASVIRIYAAKAQSGPAPYPFARNSSVTPTDVMIGCTAMLDGLGLNVFELGMWQDMSGIGKLDAEQKKRARGG